MRPRDEIDPERLYTLSEARAYLPPGRGGKRLSPSTMHRWHAAGLLKCVVRQGARKKAWYVRGSALLAFLDSYREDKAADVPAAIRSPTQRARDVARADQRARDLGLFVTQT